MSTLKWKKKRFHKEAKISNFHSNLVEINGASQIHNTRVVNEFESDSVDEMRNNRV